MAAPEIQQNLFPQNPNEKDLLSLFRKQLLLDLFCHHIGTINSFDPEKQTAQASIAYKKTVFRRNALGENKAELIDYPILADCPVIFLGGGDAALTFPVEAGDECLILFNDRSIDNWFAGQQGSALNSARLHNISDGLIIIGPRSASNSISDFDMNRAVLRKGNALVGVGFNDLVKIANSNYTLKVIFQDLSTQIKDLTSNIKNLCDSLALLTVTGVTPGGGSSGPPSNAAVITASGVAIQAIGTAIESIYNTKVTGLLE